MCDQEYHHKQEEAWWMKPCAKHNEPQCMQCIGEDPRMKGCAIPVQQVATIPVELGGETVSMTVRLPWPGTPDRNGAFTRPMSLHR